MNKSAIEVENLKVTFNGQTVLNGINFQMKKGEIAAIIGPNGAGKTTLIKAILGLIPYSGKIRVLGEKISKVTRRVGYVPQKFSFDKTFPLTVCEFLKLTVAKKEPGKIGSVLEEVDIKNCKDKLLGELSGGQLQRVLIARAILNDPEILFLDEATTGVDIEGSRTFYEILEHLNKTHNVTIVIISHEVNMVHTFATEVLCLNKDLYCKGIPKSVITDEMLKNLYGENFEMRQHTHNH